MINGAAMIAPQKDLATIPDEQMFENNRKQGMLGSAVVIAELIFHTIVRDVRKTHSNAFIALIKNMMTIFIFVTVFYLFFAVLQIRGIAVRGDFMLYLMSGIFLFLTHIRAVSSVVNSEGPGSPMMQHAPMSTAIAIASAALGALYIQLLSMLLILAGYHMFITPITILNPGGAFAMLMLAWISGCSVGLVLLSLKPWFPTFVSLATTFYQRANMVASGKMFLANSLPSYMLAMFEWNPLFHTIDQARGFVFVNYFPRVTSWEYVVWLTIILTMVGLMGEFFTRKHASASWNARR